MRIWFKRELTANKKKTKKEMGEMQFKTELAFRAEFSESVPKGGKFESLDNVLGALVFLFPDET